jgi:hypothetical protein
MLKSREILSFYLTASVNKSNLVINKNIYNFKNKDKSLSLCSLLLLV